MKLKALLTVLLVLLTALVAVPSAAADPTPGITVSPTTGLEEGTKVTVQGTGLPVGVEVSFVECDSIYGDDFGGVLYDCPALATATVGAKGTVEARVGVVSVTNRQELGAEVPVYCNQNRCHMFLVWDDPDQGKQYVGSDVLEYATVTVASISATPSSDLGNGQQVSVTGTVSNAPGHGVRVVEQACFAIVQASGCYGALPARTGTVKADGTYAVRYPVSRYLDDGTDCTDPDMLGGCRLTLVVLDSQGNPDSRYGRTDQGDPGTGISFKGASLTVSKTSGLTGGTAVTVTAERVTPGATMQLFLCDEWTSYGADHGGNCPVLKQVTSSATGTISTRVTLPDLEYRQVYPDQVKTPLYCRDDSCRLFLVNPDDVRALEAQTDPLSFTGSSATATAYLHANLPALKWITLRGTAKGAEGRTIQAVEQACYPVATGKPCYGQLPVRWGKVKADGTFAVKYPAQRHLGDQAKTDCASIETGATCRVSIIVLDSRGRHDDSFGVRALGQPGVEVTFTKS